RRRRPHPRLGPVHRCRRSNRCRPRSAGSRRACGAAHREGRRPRRGPGAPRRSSFLRNAGAGRDDRQGMRRTLEPQRAPAPPAIRRDRRVGGALAASAVALAAVSAWGYWLRASGVELHLGVVPLFGAFAFRPTIGVASTVLVAAAIVTAAPRLVIRLRF